MDKVYKNQSAYFMQMMQDLLNKGETLIISPDWTNRDIGGKELTMVTIAIEGKDHCHVIVKDEKEMTEKLTESLETMMGRLT